MNVPDGILNVDIEIDCSTHVLATTGLGNMIELPTALPRLSYTTTLNDCPEFDPPLM
jgi:hypothetical protein